MGWETSQRGSTERMADLVGNPEFRAPYLTRTPGEAGSEPGRLKQGPFLMEGELCEVLAGPDAVILVSPQGERILMQNEGKVTFHVPTGWRLMVGSQPLCSRAPFADLDGTTYQSQLQLENIPTLYGEAAPFLPA